MLTRDNLCAKINIENFDLNARYAYENDLGIELCLTNSQYFLDSKNIPAGEKVKNIRTVHLPFYGLQLYSKDGTIRKVSRQLLEKGLQITADLNVKKAIFHPALSPLIPAKGQTKAQQILCDEISALIGLAAQYEITLLAENTWEKKTTLFDSLAENFQSKHFGFCLDVAHVFCFSDLDMTNWLSSFGNRLLHYHISDNFGDEDTHLALGKGSIPFHKTWFNNTTCTLEVSPYLLKDSLQYLIKKGILDE